MPLCEKGGKRCGAGDREQSQPTSEALNECRGGDLHTVHKKYAMHMLECRVQRARLIVANARWTMTRPSSCLSCFIIQGFGFEFQYCSGVISHLHPTHTRAYGLASHHDTTHLLILGVARQGGGHSARSVLAFPLPPLPRVFGGE